MRLTVFYHLWPDGRYQEPLQDFLTAASVSDLPGVRIIPNRFEADTINELRAEAARLDGAVLYAHTKGAAENTPFRARWRRSMTARMIGGWRENLALLESGTVDVVGCHWLTEEQFPGMFGPMTIPAPGSGFFGGNFWMATTEYLRGLPACEREPRWRAESWIGINQPRAHDLLPGWPDDMRWPELCG